ncbi:MAG: MaoC family dehydratase N-terminal domain-containing protein [Chloroflexi bacterium]|nr:MaoC family dehydratase N-terminal domain-containing protein [Chloroflexota bacterium]
MGRFFEELAEGDAFSSPPRVVTGEDIDTFIRLTGDSNRLHTDDAFAREAGFSGRIAHGALVVSLATGLAWQTGILTDTTLAFRAIEAWKFSAPVYPGDAITLRGRVAERRPIPRAQSGLVRFDLDVVNQDEKVVSSGSLRMLMRMRP